MLHSSSTTTPAGALSACLCLALLCAGGAMAACNNGSDCANGNEYLGWCNTHHKCQCTTSRYEADGTPWASAADAHCEYGFVELAPTGLIIHEVIVWAEVAYIWAVSFTALALIHARRGSIRLNFQTSAVLVLMGGNLMLTLCYGIDPALTYGRMPPALANLLFFGPQVFQMTACNMVFLFWRTLSSNELHAIRVFHSRVVPVVVGTSGPVIFAILIVSTVLQNNSIFLGLFAVYSAVYAIGLVWLGRKVHQALSQIPNTASGVSGTPNEQHTAQHRIQRFTVLNLAILITLLPVFYVSAAVPLSPVGRLILYSVARTINCSWATLVFFTFWPSRVSGRVVQDSTSPGAGARIPVMTRSGGAAAARSKNESLPASPTAGLTTHPVLSPPSSKAHLGLETAPSSP